VNDDQTPPDVLAEAKLVKEWLNRITITMEYFKPYFERGDKIVKRYRDERSDSLAVARDRRFNLLWSNVQTLGPAVYAKPPKMNVTRRYHDKDAIARIASMVLERAVTYEMDCSDFDEVMTQGRDDYLLVARGTAWQRYEPIIIKVPLTAPDAPQAPEDGSGPAPNAPTGLLAPAPPGTEGTEQQPPQPSYQESLAGEHAPLDYVHWKDFIHDPAPTWKKVRWVAARTLLDKDTATKRFGAELAGQLKYNRRYQKDDPQSGSKANMPATVDDLTLVWEIWDKSTQQALWLSPDIPTQFLDRRDDPLHLRDFFPCPKPLYATLTNDRLIPVPDYALYQDQAHQIDELTERIALLTKAIAVRGAYDKSNKELANLLNERPENFLVPVDNWAAFAEKGGLKGQISFVPLDQIVGVLDKLTAMRNLLKQDVYEITGISDIVRGASMASETATAQRIKGNFATLRLDDRRKAVSRFARDGLRLTAEVIAEHFEPATIRQISGFDQMTEILERVAQGENADEIFDQVMEMLRNDPMRLTHLDIETDSMVEADQAQEQQDRVQFLSAAGSFLQQAVTAGQQLPALVPLLGQMLMFGVRGFKAGRELEDVFETTMAQLERAAAQPPPQAAESAPEPDTSMAQIQADTQRAQDELAVKQAGIQQDGEIEQNKLQQKDAIEKAELALRERELESKLQLARDELAMKFGLNPFDGYRPFAQPAAPVPAPTA